MHFIGALYTLYAVLVFLLLFIPLTMIGLILGIFYKPIWHVLLKLLAKLLLPLLFIRVDVKGRENIPRGACIIAPNQLSHIDGFIIRALVHQPYFAITEPFKKFHFIFRMWMKKLNFVDVRRTHKEDKKYTESHTRKQGVKIAAKQLKNGLSLLIFPEGHFERKLKLLKFYPGAVKLAYESGVPILPVSIQNTNVIWPPDFMLRKPARVIVQFGKPIKLKKNANPSKRLISAQTILLKKEVAKMLPKKFQSRGWENNA